MNTIIGRTALNKLKELHSDLNGLIYITGISGSGKSYLILLIIIQTIMKGFPVFILDFGNTYSAAQIPSDIYGVIKNFIQIHNIKINGFPVNIFNPRIINVDEGDFLESTAQTASRVADLVDRSMKIGTQQKAALYIAINDCINFVDYGIIPKYFILKHNYQLALKISGVNWDSINIVLKMLACSGNECKGGAKTMYLRLKPIIENIKFSDNLYWDDIISANKPMITIFNMKSLSNEEMKFVANMILDDLYGYIVAVNNKIPFMTILDEFQVCGFKFKEGAPLHSLLTQGRKYSFNAILATQHPIRELESELNQASTRIMLRSELNNINYLSKQLPNIKGINWKDIIASIPRGYCVVYDGKEVRDYKDMLVKIFSIEELLSTINEYDDAINAMDKYLPSGASLILQ